MKPPAPSGRIQVQVDGGGGPGSSGKKVWLIVGFTLLGLLLLGGIAFGIWKVVSSSDSEEDGGPRDFTALEQRFLDGDRFDDDLLDECEPDPEGENDRLFCGLNRFGFDVRLTEDPDEAAEIFRAQTTTYGTVDDLPHRPEESVCHPWNDPLAQWDAIGILVNEDDEQTGELACFRNFRGTDGGPALAWTQAMEDDDGRFYVSGVTYSMKGDKNAVIIQGNIGRQALDKAHFEHFNWEEAIPWDE